MTVTVQKVAVLGAGSWGTAFAKIVADTAEQQNNGVRTVLWGRNPESMQRCQKTRINEKYFPSVLLPKNLEFTSNLNVALNDADVVVLAIPAQSLRAQLAEIIPAASESAIFVSLAKGLEQGTQMRMSEVITDVLHECFPTFADDQISARISVLSGPNLAKEIVAEQPTASVIAAHNEETAREIARVCACSYFRPYTGTDIVGVEIGGLVKNVIALCVGMCAGLGYGDNSKASVMTRGLAEISRLALSLGGQAETMSGLAGMGDLIATCSSTLSRNHTAGVHLAQGVKASELESVMSQTAESVKTAPVVVDLAHRQGIEMPICEAVVAVLAQHIEPQNLAHKLLDRSLKHENSTRSV